MRARTLHPLAVVVASVPVLQFAGAPVLGTVARPIDLVAAAGLLWWIGAGGLSTVRRDPAPWIALAACAAWVAASGLWGFHPGFAAAKGASVLVWGAVAVCISRSNEPTDRWIALWVVGAAASLVGSVVLLPSAPDLLTYLGGASVFGLPRLRGLFVHPNLFGDWAMVTLCLALGLRATGVMRRSTTAVAVGAVLALVAAVTTAWIGVGAAAVVWGILRLTGAGSGVGDGPNGAGGRGRTGAVGAVAIGLVLISGIIWGTVRPVEVAVGDEAVTTTGARPAIWASAFEAVRTAPIIGVGAAPYLARTDAIGGGGVAESGGAGGSALWDAHSTPLSVGGQFGVVGLLLYGWLFLMIVRGGGSGAAGSGGPGGGLGTGRGPGAVGWADPIRVALLCAAVAAAAHGLVNAMEDARHLWVLAGIIGACGFRLGLRGQSDEAAETRSP